MSSELHVDQDFEKFDPWVYIQEHYGKLDCWHRNPLKYLHDFYTSHFQRGANLKVLNYGCGPIVAFEASAVLYAHKIVLAEYVKRKRAVAKLWLDKDPSRPDFSALYRDRKVERKFLDASGIPTLKWKRVLEGEQYGSQRRPNSRPANSAILEAAEDNPGHTRLMHHVVVGLTWLKKRLAALGLKRGNVVKTRLTPGADPGFWERGGSDKYIHNWGRVREGACPLP
ncbi:hypothetical protein EMCRGX_G023361 [Ephydatia muelleri]